MSSLGRPAYQPGGTSGGSWANQQAAQVLGEAIAQVQRVIVGQEHMVEQLMVGLLAKGHCLLEGVPGRRQDAGRAQLRHGRRRQLRPDPVHPRPGALRHRRHPDLQRQPGEFDVELGPVFVNFVLADEINRAPAKVQSAMLELMAEKQVSIGGTHLSGAAARSS